MRGRILIKLINYFLPGPCDTDGILKVMGSKVKVTGNCSGGGLIIDGLPLNTI